MVWAELGHSQEMGMESVSQAGGGRGNPTARAVPAAPQGLYQQIGRKSQTQAPLCGEQAPWPLSWALAPFPLGFFSHQQDKELLESLLFPCSQTHSVGGGHFTVCISGNRTESRHHSLRELKFPKPYENINKWEPL